jgi:hypothetical protein
MSDVEEFVSKLFANPTRMLSLSLHKCRCSLSVFLATQTLRFISVIRKKNSLFHASNCGRKIGAFSDVKCTFFVKLETLEFVYASL